MKRTVLVVALALAFGVGGVVRSYGQRGNGHKDDDRGRSDEHSKIQIGYAIAPVSLNVRGKNPALVGLGSYIVNAQADCAGCHSNPTYAAGGDPHLGEPEVISAATYLSGGGNLFGPFVPRNLTPNTAQGCLPD